MAQLESSLFADGVCIVAKSWSVIGEASALKLPKTVRIEPNTSKDFKGIQCFKKRQLSSIWLCDIMGLSAVQVVTSDDRETLLNYSRIRKAFIDSVDYAILNMQKTNTKSHWVGRCCVEYSKWTNKKICSSCQSTFFNVYCEDVPEFGDLFQNMFSETLQRYGYETWLCLFQLGQTAKFEKYCQKLDCLNIEEADEVVIHIARDFSRSNTCLLWNREKVVGTMPENPSEEYYPCFIGGRGNFVYDYTSDIREEHHITIGIETIKLYNQAFKQIHRSIPSPFKEAIVLSILTGDKKKKNTPEKLLGWIQAVQRSKLDLEDWEAVSVRFEVILHQYNPSTSCFLEFETFFNERWGHDDLCDMIDCITFADFTNQLNLTLDPALITLESILQDHVLESQSKEFVVHSIGKLNKYGKLFILAINSK